VTEKELKDHVVALAKHFGYLVHHDLPAMNVRGRWATHVQGDTGFPDLILVHPKGGIVVIELKRETGKVTPGQKRWLAAFSMAGILTQVVRPSDLNFITRILESHRYA
jgi:hypothetical protein